MPSHPIDVQVGLRLRQRRLFTKMTQTALANAVGLTFQQIQKYETGGNRIASSRLYEFAIILDVPVSYFFHNIEPRAQCGKGRFRPLKSGTTLRRRRMRREIVELVRAYYKIRNTNVRYRLRRMFVVLAGS